MNRTFDSFLNQESMPLEELAALPPHEKTYTTLDANTQIVILMRI